MASTGSAYKVPDDHDVERRLWRDHKVLAFARNGGD
jgi:hypothetical protein